MSKSKIVDISHHQLSSQFDWAKAAKEVSLMIIRVMYGVKVIDREYKKHVANCKKYGIPFAHYAYGQYKNVEDAKNEAKVFLSLVDKDALFLVLDVEDDTIKTCGTKNLQAASQAFIDECKKAGWKTGHYVAHHLYHLHGLNKLKSDFLWLPRYGRDDGNPHLKPDYPCELWQYTQKGRVSWFPYTLDLNQINGSKSLDWFLGKDEKKVTDTKDKETTVKLSANQEKDKQKLVDYGLMAADFQVKTADMVALITMLSALLKELEKQGALRVSTRQDMNGHWAENELKKAKDKGILKGFEDGSIQPNAPLTRAEFATVLDRLKLI